MSLTQSSGPVASGTPSSQPVGLFDFTLLEWHGWGFEVRVGLGWLIVLLVAAIVCYALTRCVNQRWLKKLYVRSVKLKFGGAEVEICPDHDTRRVAHQAWVEIKSRKVGLPFDRHHDVIVEVYDSWYQLFGVLRELAKSIPPDRLHDCDDTREVVNLLLKSLNEGLRPHLTRWQAHFRRWYDMEAEKPDCKSLTPQEIQRRFPQYDELVDELTGVSKNFIEFAESLGRVAKNTSKGQS